MLLLVAIVLIAPLAETALTFPSFGYVQSAAVNGTLTCNGKPLAHAKVKLYDEDDTDMDDLMDEGVTDEEGFFHLSGKETEITPIEPKVNIYHNCNDDESLNPLKKVCYKKISIDIPASYITDGPEASKVYPVGSINLAGSFKGETRDCLN
uniref:Transthyretin-like family protein n=1 Tax=Globodera pallida TaxID=36090 RepID=A0A183C3E4_GLOPA